MARASGTVVIVGGEPASFSCAQRLLDEGVRVTHIFPVPWGRSGASRDIGLAYPEIGEPYARLAQALGEELAYELHSWGKLGVELLTQRLQDTQSFRRGSRLLIMRDEQEARLAGGDALERQKLGDEVRLMSGAAASNYAPLATDVHMASFETHAVAFAPAVICQSLVDTLRGNPLYQAVELDIEKDWPNCRVSCTSDGVKASWREPSRQYSQEREATGELAVIAAGLDSGGVLGRFNSILVPLLAQAFCSAPLREKTRSSVVGLTASWGYERYRFDPDWRLLGCGIDPTQSSAQNKPQVDQRVQQALWQRACTIFSDLSLSDKSEAFQWGILFCATCDGLPILGPLSGEPRLQVAAGFSVASWSLGYAAGDALGKCILGGQASPLINRCRPQRFI